MEKMEKNKSYDTCTKLIPPDSGEEMVTDFTPSKCERIKFNVGGKIFECYSSTLKRFPKSKLANLDEKSGAFYSKDGEYFFDRNPDIFEVILDACRTGELHMPRETCHSSLKHELEFWEISPRYLSPCCWKAFYRADNDKKYISDLAQFYQRDTNMCLLMKDNHSLKAKLWLFLDEPKSSKRARMWSVFMTLIVIMSVVCLTMESIGSFRVDTRSPEEKKTIDYYFKLIGYYNSTDHDVVNYYKRGHPALHITMFVLFCFITVEIVTRLFVCPSVRNYLKSYIHICEILGMIGFWGSVISEYRLEAMRSMGAFALFSIFRFLSIFQLMRLVRVARNIMAFNIMRLSVQTSLPEIGVLVSLLLILVTIFGWMMYMAEVYNERFDSAFHAMYWAFITLTTVGYGDLVPETITGHVIAVACAVCGLVTLALPIGVIAASFNSYYSHHRYVSKHIKTHGSCPQEWNDKNFSGKGRENVEDADEVSLQADNFESTTNKR